MTARSPLFVAWLVLATVAPVGASPVTTARERDRAPASDSRDVVAQLEAAPLGLVGRVEGVTALDETGFVARVAPERAVSGPAPEGPIEVAFEELSTRRRVRFREGDRVLLALEPLAAGTLWQRRIPDGLRRSRVLAITASGAAFVRNPSTGALLLVEHYLALPASARRGPDGLRHLAALAADVEWPVAVAAAKALPAPRAGLERGTAGLVADALARPDASGELAAHLVAWVTRHPDEALVAPLERALDHEPVRAPVVEALGAMGRLGADRALALLESGSPDVRAAVVTGAPPALAPRIADRLAVDPDPAVREAAVRRLADLEGVAALEPLLGAFSDASPDVRLAAARRVAGFGPEVAPRLADVARGWPMPAPATAIEALRWSRSPASREVLDGLAEEHPDPAIRNLARIALGREAGHRH